MYSLKQQIQFNVKMFGNKWHSCEGPLYIQGKRSYRISSVIRWSFFLPKQCVSVCSNSRNDVPPVAQRYRTIAAHTRCHVSVLVVFWCNAQFCRFDKADATADVRRQSPTATLIPLFSSSELTGCGYPGLLDQKNRSDMCHPTFQNNSKRSTL